MARAPAELKASQQEKLALEGYRLYGQDASVFAAASEIAMAEALDRACQSGGGDRVKFDFGASCEPAESGRSD